MRKNLLFKAAKYRDKVHKDMKSTITTMSMFLTRSDTSDAEQLKFCGGFGFISLWFMLQIW